ncbi:MAG: tetratricopeptide repeat protein [Candidatus Peribacteraceae bacterium]|nr:tetratricopeptide repeat protein [Candidatus Peribacteraceae bacterium]
MALGVIAGFFVLSFLIYGSSLQNGFVRWDDGLLVTENPAVRSINAETLGYVFTHFDPELYIPLTFVSYQIDFLFGGSPSVIHFHSLLLHTLNALLTAWLFLLLTKGQKGIALLAGLLFLVHPLHTEAVAWVSSRKDVLSGFFFLASLLAFLSYRQGDDRRLYAGSVALFLCALLSKVTVIGLPVLLLLLAWRERRPWREAWRETVPFFALALLFGIVALFGKQTTLESTSLLPKVLLALQNPVFVLTQFLWPFSFSALYPYTGPLTPFTPAFLVPAAVLLVFSGLVILSLRVGRDIAFGMLFFLLFLVPTVPNLARGEFLLLGADRYAYLPSVGVLWLVLLIGSVLWDALAARRSLPLRAVATAALMVLPLAGLSWKAHGQSLVWKDTETLFRHVLHSYPDSFMAHNNIGNALRRRGMSDEAIAEFRAALAVRPDPKTWSNLGAVYRKEGMISEALAAYDEALKTGSGSGEPYMGLGLVYAGQGRANDAYEAFTQAIERKPCYAEALLNRGSLLLRSGHFAEAEADEREAVRCDPLSPEARYNLSIALLQQGKRKEAQGQLEHLLRLQEYAPAREALRALQR